MKFLGVQHAMPLKTIESLWPLSGFHVFWPGAEISHNNIFQKDLLSLATALVAQTGSM